MTDDTGEITANSIYEFFRQEQTIDLIKRLQVPMLIVTTPRENTINEVLMTINIAIFLQEHLLNLFHIFFVVF